MKPLKFPISDYEIEDEDEDEDDFDCGLTNERPGLLPEGVVCQHLAKYPAFGAGKFLAE